MNNVVFDHLSLLFVPDSAGRLHHNAQRSLTARSTSRNAAAILHPSLCGAPHGVLFGSPRSLPQIGQIPIPTYSNLYSILPTLSRSRVNASRRSLSRFASASQSIGLHGFSLKLVRLFAMDAKRATASIALIISPSTFTVSQGPSSPHSNR